MGRVHAPPDPAVDPAPAEQVKGRNVLGDPQRVGQWQQDTPVPSRSEVVRAAIAARNTSGDGRIDDAGEKCCSTGQTDS
jgi:hypothetical protein